MPNNESADIIIVGAGLAGATASAVLGDQGLRVILLDSRHPYPECFKAEKIEEDQANLFRKFGLMDSLLPATGQIRTILNAQNGKVLYEQPIEQYGIHYHDMVNLIRRGLPETVDFRIGRVESITTGPQSQQVRMSSGEEFTSRLVIAASGTAAQLCAGLGIQRTPIREQHMVAFGFKIERPDGESFPFDSVTYYPIGTSTRVGYLTLFLIGRTMRANFFTFWNSGDQQVRQFVREPAEVLNQTLPGVEKAIGAFRVTSRVECASINLYAAREFQHPGLALMGDAFQSVCPATGTGLSRVLTDVDVLSECVPGWLSTPGMGLEKIRQYYDHPRKIAADASSRSKAEYGREVSTVKARRWAAHQARLHYNALLQRMATWKRAATTLSNLKLSE